MLLLMLLPSSLSSSWVIVVVVILIVLALALVKPFVQCKLISEETDSGSCNLYQCQ